MRRERKHDGSARRAERCHLFARVRENAEKATCANMARVGSTDRLTVMPRSETMLGLLHLDFAILLIRDSERFRGSSPRDSRRSGGRFEAKEEEAILRDTFPGPRIEPVRPLGEVEEE